MSTDAAIYLLARAVPGLLQLVALGFYTRMLEPQEFGRYTLVLSTVTLVAATMFRGILQAQIRFFPEAHSQADLRDLERSLMAIVSSVVLLLVLLWAAAASMFAPGTRGVYAFGAILLAVHVLVEYALERTRAIGRTRLFAILTSLRSIIVVSALVASIHLFDRAAATLVISHSAALALLLIVLAFKPGLPVPGVPSTSWLHRVTRYGLPLVPVATFQLALSIGDRYMIAWRGSEALVGEYTAAYTLAEYTVILVLSSIHLASFPHVSRAWAEGGRTQAAPAMQQTLLLILGIGLPVALSVMSLGPTISELLGESYRGSAATIMLWVAPAMILAAVRSFYFDIVLHLHERTGLLIAPLAIGTLVNVAANYFLIPIWGLLGASVSTFLAYAASLGLGSLIATRIWQVPVSASALARLLGAFALFAMVHIPAFFANTVVAFLLAGLAWLTYFAVLLVPDAVRGAQLGSVFRPSTLAHGTHGPESRK